MIRRLLSRLGTRSAGADPARGADPAPGDLWSVRTDDGGFGVVKVLATDMLGVHVRLYSQRFERRPTSSELGDLTLAAFGPGGSGPFSAGHLPLGRQTFAGWEPEPIRRGGAVDEEELEGFGMWKEASGGYF